MQGKVCQTNKLWRHLNDIPFITTINEKVIESYVKDLNSIKSKIRFTFNYERNERINFLDTIVLRINEESINIR